MCLQNILGLWVHNAVKIYEGYTFLCFIALLFTSFFRKFPGGVLLYTLPLRVKDQIEIFWKHFFTKYRLKRIYLNSDIEIKCVLDAAK